MYFLLSLLGFSSACNEKEKEIPVMYGTPRIAFRVQGKVSTADGTPVPGIEVSHPELASPVYSDEEGLYTIEGNSDPLLVLSFRDIDGPENGGEFEPLRVETRFDETERIRPGDGMWDLGSYARSKADVVLTEKGAEE